MSELNDTVCLELDGLEIGWQVGPTPVEDGYVTLYSLRQWYTETIIPVWLIAVWLDRADSN
jgi:hypothetical protein